MAKDQDVMTADEFGAKLQEIASLLPGEWAAENRNRDGQQETYGTLFRADGMKVHVGYSTWKGKGSACPSLPLDAFGRMQSLSEFFVYGERDQAKAMSIGFDFKRTARSLAQTITTRVIIPYEQIYAKVIARKIEGIDKKAELHALYRRLCKRYNQPPFQYGSNSESSSSLTVYAPGEGTFVRGIRLDIGCNATVELTSIPAHALEALLDALDRPVAKAPQGWEVAETSNEAAA